MASRWIGLRTSALLALVTIAMVGVRALWSKRAEPLSAASPMLLAQPPPTTIAFPAAYARGDELTADELASPLCRAEWERRGLSADARTRLAWPTHREGEPFPERLRFTFAGGVADAKGFGHLLFAVRPALPDRPASPSVFRVDVDSQGRVIWLELVWHFAEEVDAVRAVQDPAELVQVPAPPMPCCVHLLLGVASMDGREGYYAYALEREATSSADSSQAPRPTVVKLFAFAID